jgi:transcriptional antiterminator NusG
MEKRWYVIHTYSGHENKVKTILEREIVAQGMEDKITKVIIPTEEVVEMKNGKKTTTAKKFLPSYIMVEMEMTKEAWHLVRNTPGVTSFVSAGDKPQPLRNEEVERIMAQMDRARTRAATDIPFKVGDAVKVIDGPFADFSGVVNEINPERGKLKVMVSIFGRSTPVELNFLQVKSI